VVVREVVVAVLKASMEFVRDLEECASLSTTPREL
jgi:hypothetical protein